MIKLTIEDFIERANKVHNNKYDYSKAIYINGKTKLDLFCNFHGSFQQLPFTHLGGGGCPKCSIINSSVKNTKTKESFLKECIEIHGNKYDYSLVDYKNSTNKIIIICKKHGNFLQLPSHHLKGSGCPKCSGKYKNTEEFILESKEIHGDEYDYSLVEYKRSSSKVKIICKKHGIYEQSPDNHLKGAKCNKCSGGMLRNTKYFIDKANEIHNYKYDYSITNYTNSRSNVEIICKKHGVFKQKASNHLMGNGCFICNESKGEKEIDLFLKENNIIYNRQYRFKKCRYKLPLPFDFYLPEYNICIEFDGQQHFKSHPCWGGEKQLEEQKIKDEIKNNFCISNNILLYRIDYTENLENKLKELINSFLIKN
jgi:hypothetical protein